MINPFQEIAERLSNIEELLINLQATSNTSTSVFDDSPFGDFHWLRGTCPGIPASTLRIKSAAGEIPGVKKFGKRVLYEKAVVLDWLRNKTRQYADTASIEQAAEEQFNRQLAKKGGPRA